MIKFITVSKVYRGLLREGYEKTMALTMTAIRLDMAITEVADQIRLGQEVQKEFLENE